MSETFGLKENIVGMASALISLPGERFNYSFWTKQEHTKRRYLLYRNITLWNSYTRHKHCEISKKNNLIFKSHLKKDEDEDDIF